MKTYIIRTSGKFLSAILLLTFASASFAQAPAAKKQDEADAEFKKEVTNFLRETASELGGLRTAENRISFTAELASLMWFNDEREARSMYVGVAGDFKQLIGTYDSQLNAIEAVEASDGDSGPAVTSIFFGDDSDKEKLRRKFRTAMSVRQLIAETIAEHDPMFAFDFYFDSLMAITNVERRKDYEKQFKYMELRLLSQIAEKDPVKGAELGRRSLENGVNYQHIEILRKLYAKDRDKGAEFADAITSKLKDRSKENYSVAEVLRMGIDNFESVKREGGKKPMFSEQNLRDLSEVLAQMVLDSNGEDFEAGDPLMSAEMIAKFSPGRAAQIRAKFGKNMPVATATPRNPNRYTVRAAVPAPATPSPGSEVKTVETVAAPDGEVMTISSNRNAEERVFSDVQNLGTKQLPKEEREKIVAQARKIVSEMKSKDQKIMALSMLAAQVAKAGDKELAGEVLKDAAGLVNPQPKNYKDFILVWMLASAYAESDPDKAFPLIEDAIFRLNDTITGAVRVAEFIDTNGDFINDGEIQIGAFGGSMVREMTREIGMVNGTLQSLAKADINKTKALTNRFDRAELRVLAKMMVLRAILDDNKSPDGKETEIESEGY